MARWLLYALVGGLIAQTLLALAHWKLQRFLDSSATTTIAALAQDQPPYRWPLRSADDIIAGRVFDSGAFSFGDDGLSITSANETWEVGLPLRHALDLARYHVLTLTSNAEAAFTLGLAATTYLGSELCIAAPVPVAAGIRDVRLSLPALDWTCGGQQSAMPPRAALLRLRVDAGAKAQLTLRDVALGASRKLLIPATAAQIPTLPALANSPALDAAARAIAKDPGTLPVAVLPMQGRVEQILAARDRVESISPAAVLVSNPAIALEAAARASNAASEGHHPSVADDGKSAGAWAWIVLTGYATLLGVLCLRHPRDRRVRALLELIAVLIGPFWLIAGGGLGAGTDSLTLAVIALSATFAALLAAQGWRRRTLRFGPPRAWIVPALTVIAGVVIVVSLYQQGARPPESATDNVLRYTAWVVVQQILICVIVSDRLQRIGLATRWVILGAASAFALLHVPNATLSILTLIAGFAWVWNWVRYRSLLPNIVAHALCGAIVLHGLPGDWLRSAVVGTRYFL